MDKFIKIEQQDLLVSGTSADPAGSSADLKVTGDLFANVSVGDIVHQTTDNKYYTVASKIDDNELTLTALDTGTTPIPQSKAFSIYSATSSKYVLVSSANVKLVEQSGRRSVTIAYDEPAGASDLVTITHAPLPAGDETMRDEVEEAVYESLQTAWNQVVYTASLSKKVVEIVIG